MIDLGIAGQLLDFGARIGSGRRAEEQLEGAVAIHNILSKHRVAYLADEVGMGKTYVALGALALFRHYNPGFRVLVIAPRENIQRKWVKEWTSFAAQIVKFPDLRSSAIDRRPARPNVVCENLIGLVRECAIDTNRDFFMRLPSFSLPLGEAPDEWRRIRDGLRSALPWMKDEVFDLRNKQAFKENFARAVCCALPMFDLVIIDEAHHLKHGMNSAAATRNKVLALTLGHPAGATSSRLFPGYALRASRVLFLSATPLEVAWNQLWNQLDVLGHGAAFETLRNGQLGEDAGKHAASQFLIRRVAAIQTGRGGLTKNMYRREWRNGGVVRHDEPIVITDDRQRLIVALVQKKVSELLGSERFNSSFQTGLLASFESFLETTRTKRKDDADPTFDGEDQAVDSAERDGIDVHEVNRISRDFRKLFGHDMPHPKMDAVVESLSGCWTTGQKTLIFVRRVASVGELKRRLDEHYDRWLIGLLRSRLPQSVVPRLETIVKAYKRNQHEVERALKERAKVAASAVSPSGESLDDHGGTDTFFAWFFRGEGPADVVSGASIQRRFIQKKSSLSTFFEINHVAEILAVPAERVLATLGQLLAMDTDELRRTIRVRAAKFLSRAMHASSVDRMEAAEAAAVELMRELPGELGSRARVLWHERFEASVKKPHAVQAPDVADWLEKSTFFTELARPERRELRAALWPEPVADDATMRFREQELRAQLLASAARLGHAFIDLYILVINRLGSIEPGVEMSEARGIEGRGTSLIVEYLDLLEQQRSTPLEARGWAAFDELHELARNFELILDVNAPEAMEKPLSESARYFGLLLRKQQPAGGMSGQVNRTLVQQFRMPGYPLVLVTTDVLQEGEDLHTFCSRVQNYGMTWTPSAMEQRIGRIDRVRSQTERRLNAFVIEPSGADLLQVYYPFLDETVEVLQVQRVLERMSLFMRLMHEGGVPPPAEQGRIDIGKELIIGKKQAVALHGPLQSAFPIPAWALQGDIKALAVTAAVARGAHERFHRFHGLQLDEHAVEWEKDEQAGILLGTVRLSNGRIQPFGLRLGADGDRLLLKCISPVGRVDPAGAMPAISLSSRRLTVRIGAILARDDCSYDLTVEEDVLLGSPQHDAARAAMLIRRVAERADVLERTHLRPLDQKLDLFESDLRKEVANGKS